MPRHNLRRHATSLPAAALLRGHPAQALGLYGNVRMRQRTSGEASLARIADTLSP